ncbi:MULTISPECIES: hypothetical protein [Enterobacteriaceae]|uniref:DUF5862 family protein n=1 Tax=Enterobacteriaceae TaxID=543 RepID=UPI0028A12ABE|nr:hypothetical protein [Cedecea neteri]
MRELALNEMSAVSGGVAAFSPEFFKRMDQIFSNSLDGMATGMSIGGKYGGAGGFGFGALSQLVGLIVPTIMGGTLGFVSGIILGYEKTTALLADYRQQFGQGSVG